MHLTSFEYLSVTVCKPPKQKIVSLNKYFLNSLEFECYTKNADDDHMIIPKHCNERSTQMKTLRCEVARLLGRNCPRLQTVCQMSWIHGAIPFAFLCLLPFGVTFPEIIHALDLRLPLKYAPLESMVNGKCPPPQAS